MRFALTLVVETKKRQIQICLLVTETPQQPQQFNYCSYLQNARLYKMPKAQTVRFA